MTDASTILCPECGSVQHADAPFCDNCGFRLGALSSPQESSVEDTEVERPAVTRSDLTGGGPPPQPGAVPPGPESAGSRAAETEVEGFDAIPPEMDQRTLSEVTVNEGVVPVTSDASSHGGQKAMAAAPRAGAPHQSGLHTLSSESRGRRALWGFAWLASIVGVAMGVWYLARGDSSSPNESDDVVAAQPAVVDIPAGTFPRGLDESTRSFVLRTCMKSADDTSRCDQDKLLAGEFPQESVQLETYGIDRTEVTLEQWRECVAADECPSIPFKDCKVYTHQGLQISLRVPRSLQQSQAPVTCVTRDEAADYCAWAGGRLPTHDEWERGARGTKDRLFPWGASWDPKAANWGEADIARVPVVGEIDGFARVAPPGQFPDGKSPAGLLDMAGNVAEWVAGEPVAARGGSWTSNPFELRTTGRLELEATDRRTDVGFRCAYER